LAQTIDVPHNTQKNCGTDFRNFDCKTFGEFLKLYNFRLSLWAAAADVADRPQ